MIELESFLYSVRPFGWGLVMQHFQELRNDDGSIEKKNILNIIPYKKKFLFVDEISFLGEKNIQGKFILDKGAEFLDAHFKDFPLMPGALVLEGMGQIGSFLVRSLIPNYENQDVLAYKIKEARFMKPILPGSVVTYDVHLHEMIGNKAVMEGKVFVEDEKVAECFFTLVVVEKKTFRGQE